MKELPIFFENNSHSIFGILHSPEKNDNSTGFVFCLPFFYEGILCRRIYALFARRLASIGYHVLRFNYMGTGDSSGNFEDTTIKTCISDIIRSINVMREKSNVKKIGILGMRLGATLAGIAAVNSEIKIEILVLWDPILNVRKYMDNCLRQSITFQNVLFHEIIYDRNHIVEQLISKGEAEYNGYYFNAIDGHIINSDFYTQLIDMDLLSQIRNFSGNMLILQIDKNDMSFRTELQELASLCKNNSKLVDLLQADEPVSWRTSAVDKWLSEPNQIFDITENWIQKLMKKDKF